MAQITKIIPFDWKYYQANKEKCRVITSTEIPLEVTQLTNFECDSKYPLTGIIDNKKQIWLEDGKYLPFSHNHVYDLQLEITEEVVESWVNVYENANGIRFAGSTFLSFEEALQYKGDRAGRYICTLPLHELKEEGGEK